MITEGEGVTASLSCEPYLFLSNQILSSNYEAADSIVTGENVSVANEANVELKAGILVRLATHIKLDKNT